MPLGNDLNSLAPSSGHSDLAHFFNHEKAIQFWSNKKKSENPIWTPKDTPNEWLLAKMFFNNSNGQVSFSSDVIISYVIMMNIMTSSEGLIVRLKGNIVKLRSRSRSRSGEGQEGQIWT